MGVQQVGSIGPCTVIVSIDEGRWHCSIAHPRRMPTWDEVRAARTRYTPDQVPMALVLPSAECYVNEHPYCLHVWELRDPFPEWTPATPNDGGPHGG